MSGPSDMSELLAHAAFVRRLAVRLVGESEADDVVQETWVAALRGGRDLEGGDAGRLRAWLGQVTRRLAGKRLRGEVRRRRREEGGARSEGLPSAGELAARDEALRRLTRAIEVLGDEDRGVLVLRFYDGLAPRLIAERLGISPAAARKRVQRAVGRLREELDGRSPGGREGWLGLFAPFTHQEPSALAALTAAMATKKAIGIGVVALVGAVGIWRGVSWDGVAPGRHAVALDADEASGERLARGAEIVEAGGGAGASRASVEAEIESGGAGEVGLGPVVRGRVVDSEGSGISQAVVLVLADEDPFPKDSALPGIAADRWVGRQVSTRDDGDFVATLAAPRRVLVAILQTPGVRPADPAAQVWVDVPPHGIDGVELVGVRRGTAVLEVRARDATTGTALTEFTTVLTGSGLRQHRSKNGVVRYELPIEEPEVEVLVRLADPKPPQPVERKLTLRAGDERELELVIHGNDVLSGWVVDASGAPIEDALVWFGDARSGRGDEPFRALRPRAVSGVRTDADGWFEVSGNADHLNAWHPEYTQRTLAVGAFEETRRLELGPRGAITGRAYDRAGEPAAGISLMLDRDDKTLVVTDDEGRFRFDNVEAGVRGVMWDSVGYWAVDVTPGETAHVELTRGTALTLILTDDGVDLDVSLDGFLLARDLPARMHEIDHSRAAPTAAEQVGRFRRIVDEHPCVVPEVEPGRWLLITHQGYVAEFTYTGEPATIPLGASDLRVRCDLRGGVALAPADATSFERLCSARIRLRPGEDGYVRWFGLEPGRWLLLGEAGRVLRELTLEPGETQVELD